MTPLDYYIGALTLLGYLVLAVAVLYFVKSLIGLVIEIRDQPARSMVWREGYYQGVEDERQAAALDIPEYRIPNRENPYLKKNQKEKHADRT